VNVLRSAASVTTSATGAVTTQPMLAACQKLPWPRGGSATPARQNQAAPERERWATVASPEVEDGKESEPTVANADFLPRGSTQALNLKVGSPNIAKPANDTRQHMRGAIPALTDVATVYGA
jgi:hypothetical protein